MFTLLYGYKGKEGEHLVRIQNEELNIVIEKPFHRGGKTKNVRSLKESLINVEKFK